ncbi:hypothetical protein [Rhizobium halophytocola]|uniref:Uncharacterized protein n=1 Tax=Rhizobium halophytocola TaxID=735519 RepID=A0ABS4DT10_9HYPH|nr:hypothetical protein [Rhizobium halophytocola]MBP1848834.1 hypothetical protein [Rhizobium halophytocola]
MVGYSSFVTPQGNVVPVINGGRYFGDFINTATFTPKCAEGEYRQFVKGEFVANGSVVSHRLCGNFYLQKGSYQEDGCPPGNAPGVRAYGYRSRLGDGYDRYAPSQSDGCTYAMFDAPGFNHLKKDITYKIDLTFKADLIDTSKKAVLVSKEWTVSGQTVAHSSEKETMADNGLSPLPLGEDDYVLRTYQTINLETKEPEVHIVVGRKVGLAPLDPASLHIEVTDGEDHPVAAGKPVIYEVGDLRSATATIVVPLTHKCEGAAKVRLSSKANAVLLTIHPS